MTNLTRGVPWILLLLFIGLLSTSSEIVISTSFEIQAGEIIRVSSTYTPHTPIFINNKTEFNSQGFPGSGTSINPYIISGLNITNSNGPLIEINNVLTNYIIRDNYFNGLNNASGVSVTIESVLEEEIEISIQNNIITNTTENGIFSESPISGTNDNLQIIIANNTVFENFGNGIEIGLTGHKIMNNTIRNNSGDGIKFWGGLLGASFNEVINNLIDSNDIGLNLKGVSTRNYIFNNSVTGNNIGVLIEWLSEANEIYGNNFVNNNEHVNEQIDREELTIFRYNYYSDGQGIDNNGDGIIDDQYVIQTRSGLVRNTDPYPLANPFPILLYYLPQLKVNATQTNDKIDLSWNEIMDSLFRKAEYSISYQGSNGTIEITRSFLDTSFRWIIPNIESGIYQFTVTATLPEQNFTQATIDVSIIGNPTSQIISTEIGSSTTTTESTVAETTITSSTFNANPISSNFLSIDRFTIAIALLIASIVILSITIRSITTTKLRLSDHECENCGYEREFGNLFCGDCGFLFDKANHDS